MPLRSSRRFWRSRSPRIANVPGTAALPRILLLVTAAILLLGGCGTPRLPEEDAGDPARPEPARHENLPDSFIPHPDFELTLGELRSLTIDLSGDIRGMILARPQAFLDDVAEALREPPELLWLVDRQHPLPADYVPEDLVRLERYADRLTLNREDLSLRLILMPDLLAMAEAAAQAGIVLDLSSTYRSYRYQEWLFEYWVEQIGLERAERSSARPGTSQHQLGTAIDFGSITGPFAEHPAGKWLAANASAYGFSLSYPRGYEEITGYIFEPWHFRYISRAGTRLEKRYFGGIQQFLLEFWHDAGDTFRQRHRPAGQH